MTLVCTRELLNEILEIEKRKLREKDEDKIKGERGGDDMWWWSQNTKTLTK